MQDNTNPNEGFESRNEEFVRLLLIYQRRIYGFILAMVPNYTDAEDLFQQVAMVMCRRFSEYQPGTSFLAWGIQIARFQIMNIQKINRRSRVQFSSETMETLFEQTCDHLSRMDQRITALEHCIKKLNPDDGDLVHSRYEQGMKIKDIAQQANRPMPHLYKAFNRIHLFLRHCVSAQLQEATETT